MSIASDCGACKTGDHDRHDPDHGIQPGLIGGTYCNCTGDCAERAAEATRQFIASHPLPPVTAIPEGTKAVPVHKATEGIGPIKALCRSGGYQLAEQWANVTCSTCLARRADEGGAS